jgi:hypothetical protein
MAFPTGSHTSTTLAEWIPAIWGERVNDFFRSKLVMADFFTDRSSDLADGGNTLHTPTLTEMSASAKANATAVLSGGIEFISMKTLSN